MTNVIDLKNIERGKKAKPKPKPVKKYYDEWAEPAFTAFNINGDLKALQIEVGDLLRQAYTGGLRIGAERVAAELRPHVERIQSDLQMGNPGPALELVKHIAAHLKLIAPK